MQFNDTYKMKMKIQKNQATVSKAEALISYYVVSTTNFKCIWKTAQDVIPRLKPEKCSKVRYEKML